MLPEPSNGSELNRYRERADSAAARAARAGEIAEKHERLAKGDHPVRRAIHDSLATAHRRSQARHMVAFALYERHARRLAKRASADHRSARSTAPRLIESVAWLLGRCSVYIDLSEGAAVASDATARAAHDAEIVLGVGPGHASLTDGALVVDSSELRARWPLFAEAIESLGIKRVASVPLGAAGTTLGSLTTLCTSAEKLKMTLGYLQVIGDATTDLLLAEQKDPRPDVTGIIEHIDVRHELHQAAGMVAVQYHCAAGDALALLRARAFAAGTTIDGLARDVISGEIRFDR